MIGGAILAGLLQATSSMTIPVATISEGTSFPSEIRDQVGQYIDCLTDRANASMRAAGGVSEGAEIRRIYAEARTQCAGVRAAMAAQADLVLKGAHWSSHKRKRAIENALASAEKHGDDFANMADRMNAAWRAKQGKDVNAPN